MHKEIVGGLQITIDLR